MAEPIDPGVDIGHVHLKVADVDRALDFYCGVLGFELMQRYGDDAAFVSAGLRGSMSREDVLARVRQQVRLTLRRNAGEAVVWVAHGDIVIIATLWAKEQPLSALSSYKGANYIAHASVTKFVFVPGQELPLSVDYIDPNKAA